MKRIAISSMDDISYRKLVLAQQDIINYRTEIMEKISSTNDDGYRVVKPEYFLSGEVAAYKILNSWIKRMELGDNVINEKVLTILQDIGNLLYWSDNGDFSNQDDIDCYEEASINIWFSLLETKDLAPSFEFNNQIVAIAALGETLKGKNDKDNDYLNYSWMDLLDWMAIAEAYVVAHTWLMELPKEKFDNIIRDTEIYRYHFNLLN